MRVRVRARVRVRVRARALTLVTLKGSMIETKLLRRARFWKKMTTWLRDTGRVVGRVRVGLGVGVG